MFSRDNRGDDLFKNSVIDTSNPDKIIIREKSAPKKKVRRRVKKGTKDQVIQKRQEIKQASKVKVVSEKKAEKAKAKSIFDTTSFEFVDLNEAPDREVPKSSKADKVNAYKIPRLSEIKASKEANNKLEDNDLSSEFRKASADWKDAATPNYSGLDELRESSGFKMPSAIQMVAMALAVVLFVSSIMTTNVYAKKQCADNREEAFARLSSYEDTTFEQVAQAVESVETPVSMEEAMPVHGSKVLSLVLTSVEKDLKIKLIDEDSMLVKNVPWSVTVDDNNGKTSEEADDDQDGIIHMTDVSAGDYSVTLNASEALAEYELPAASQQVSVKAKVEYKVIADIKEEIKSEKEINAAAEDAAGNQAADVETGPANALADTVEFVESTKVANGEEYIEATPDLTKTAAAKKTNLLANVISQFKATAKANFTNRTIAYPLLLANCEGEHTWDKYSNNGDGTHSIACSADGCDGTNGTESCDFENGKCKKCGYEKPSEGNGEQGGGQGEEKPAHSHNFNKYTSNNDGTHKISCSGDGCSEGNGNEKCDTNGSDGACSKCGYKKPQETTISLSQTSVSLTVGASTNITATVTPSASVTYSSSNTGVATVDGSGKITAVKAGSATITATANGKSATCSVTVTEKPAEASLSLSGTTSVKVNETTKITANITPSGKKVTGVSFADSAIATCSVDGNTITVKGLKAGSTKMKVVSDNGKDATVTITVTTSETKYADDAQLYDASKNALYVKDGDNYRLAKYKDYKKDASQKFYRKQEIFLYTGWQTIDGQKCYFDKDHKKVTGKQIIGGVEYDFGDGGSVSSGSGTLGIDVSKYQPSINWSAVKSSGVDYVIIRCGYRGSSTGVLVEDPYFKSHIKGAKAAGLKVGVYFFTTALTEAEAVEEASMCAYLCNGYGLDFPIFMDCESSPRPGYNGMSAGQRTAVIKAFCNTIRSAGYSAGVYANKTWLSSYMHAGELSGYKIWLAQYNSAGPTYSGKYDMWQYTSKGSVSGISGYVDMNRCYYR